MLREVTLGICNKMRGICENWQFSKLKVVRQRSCMKEWGSFERNEPDRNRLSTFHSNPQSLAMRTKISEDSAIHVVGIHARARIRCLLRLLVLYDQLRESLLRLSSRRVEAQQFLVRQNNLRMRS